MKGWEDPYQRRTATSIALIDPERDLNFLFEATPHLPEQLYTLQIEAPTTRYGLNGVFLTHAHIGHYAGLMHFGREAMNAQGLPVYAMPLMSAYLSNNGPWSQLIALDNVALMPLRDNHPVALTTTLSVTPMLVPHRDEFSETVGYHIEGPNKSALFIPDINKWADWDTDIAALIKTVDYALLDATFFADGELGNRDMSQIPHPFVVESMALFSDLSATERDKVWFIHFNHTNPLLNPESLESLRVLDAGYHIAVEGLRLAL
jgi:pyrroloquinoline quinone biosynthesis protein B